MKIHAIQTGTVAVKTRQTEGSGHGMRRRMSTLMDRQWTEPLPILAFAIEHPDGVIVVDTGETSRTAEPGYFPRWHPYYRLGVRLWVTPEQEIGPQLRALGIESGDVRRVVITHMHTDHAGGLHHFPGTEILVTRREMADASGFAGQVRGFPNPRWPDWFDPTLVDFESRPYGPFPQSLPLTDAGDVTLLPLPGHTAGHVGVAVEDGDQIVLLAGDASYTEDVMRRGVPDGVLADEAAARQTHERIWALAERTPTVYLVAHDPESERRLAERRPTEPPTSGG